MTLKEAKNLYKKHRCSLFGVFRDEGPECETFLRVNVSQTVRRKWAMEFMDEFISEFEQHPDSSSCYHNISSVLHAHHDEDFFIKYVGMLKRMTISPNMRFHVCDDILGMRNLNTRVGILDYVQDINNKELFDFLLGYIHDFLNCPIEIADDRKSRYEAMKDVAAEYDKIQMGILLMDTLSMG